MYGSQPTKTAYNVQQILVIAFEFTGVAHGVTINFLCGPWGQKGWTALHYMVRTVHTSLLSHMLHVSLTLSACQRICLNVFCLHLSVFCLCLSVMLSSLLVLNHVSDS